MQVSYQKCDALEELEEACDPQKEELHKVDRPKQDEDQGKNTLVCLFPFTVFSEASVPRASIDIILILFL